MDIQAMLLACFRVIRACWCGLTASGYQFSHMCSRDNQCRNRLMACCDQLISGKEDCATMQRKFGHILA